MFCTSVLFHKTVRWNSYSWDGCRGWFM